jgi:flavin reductase
MQMPTLQTLDLSAGFRNAMHRLATTFSVVTCADEGGWHGMTVTTVRSVALSHRPYLFASIRLRLSMGRSRSSRTAYLYLINAQANLFCKMESLAHFESHGIFIGRPAEMRFAEDASPPVYQDGNYVTTARLVDP